MREILFRGKRKDNGEWIEGFYTKSPSSITYIIDTVAGCASPRAVYPATVGQYVGEEDINGRRIFEGDLCLCDRHINDAFDKKVFEIMYDPARGFYGENFNEIGADEFCMCEVVGNIHDNPELLKDGE